MADSPTPHCTPETSKPRTFTFSLPTWYTGFRWLVVLAFGVSAANALAEWFHQGNPTGAISFLVQGGVLLLLWRRVFSPLPSAVVLEGPDLIFKDVPSFWIQISMINVPIIIRREVRIPVASMVPEWISGSLTWNDMEKGRTVFLAKGEQAAALVAWLAKAGVASPVGG